LKCDDRKPAAITFPLHVRRGDVLLSLTIAILPFVVFWRQAFLQAFWWVFDVREYFFAYHEAARRVLQSDALPLWNPYAFSGMPLLGDGQTAMFYPPNWLFFLMPAPAALNWAILLQFSIAGVGMYLYTRGLGLSRAPSVTSAVVYMFSGFMVSHIVHLSILSGAALVPLVFLGVERAIVLQSRRWFVVAALFIALQVFTGHPQIPAYAAVAAAIYAPVRALTIHGLRAAVIAPLKVWLMYLLGFGISAIQLVPWAEVAAHSPRAARVTESFLFGLHLGRFDLLLAIFPFLRGSVQTGVFGSSLPGEGVASGIWEHGFYVGIIPLLLAAVAVIGIRREGGVNLKSLTMIWCLITAVALFSASGAIALWRWVIMATPFIGRLRAVVRVLVLADVGLAVLAGIGLQRILAAGRQPGMRRRLLAIAMCAVLIPFTAALVIQAPALRDILTRVDLIYTGFRLPNVWVPLLLCVAAASVFLWWANRGATRVSLLVAAILAALDLGLFAYSFHPSGGREKFGGPPVASFLKRDAGLFRIMPFCGHPNVGQYWDALQGSASMPYGISSANGFNSLQTREYTDYLFSPSWMDVSYGLFSDEHALEPESPLLSSLNVKYVLIPQHEHVTPGSSFRQVYRDAAVTVYENLNAYPRAWFPETVEVRESPTDILSRVRADGFDGRKVALIQARDGPALRIDATRPAAPGSISYGDWGPDHLSLTTSAPGSRVLVLSEMFFPGWDAFIDGKETPIYRANYLFRAVQVPGGTHDVSFTYRPGSALWGMTISMLASLIAIVVAGVTPGIRWGSLAIRSR
jgi:hypothetical protein